jgi:hypothetical protein
MIAPEDSLEIIGRGQKVSLSCLSSAANKLRKMSDTDFTSRLSEGGESCLLTVGPEKQSYTRNKWRNCLAFIQRHDCSAHP